MYRCAHTPVFVPVPVKLNNRTAYTAVYFSELYLVEDRDEDCVYSSSSLSPSPLAGGAQMGMLPDFSRRSELAGSYRSEAWVQASQAVSALRDSTTCGSDYPYCFESEGECRKLNDYPWHNKGMEHIHLQEYMSW